jgi:hypothetical protein
MSKISKFGEYEMVPHKCYVNLKRKWQFPMIGSMMNTTMEISINLKEYHGTLKLMEQPKGNMYQFAVVIIRSVEEVDTELITWMHKAFHPLS